MKCLGLLALMGCAACGHGAPSAADGATSPGDMAMSARDAANDAAVARDMAQDMTVGPTIGAHDYVVAVDGNDANPGTLAKPFATLGHARDVLRAWLKTNTMTADVNVFVRTGDYALTTSDCTFGNGTPNPAGLCLTDADSGNGGFTVHYRNYDAVGSARLLGAAPVTGWSLYSGGIYRAPYTGATFNELFENGARAVKARTPNIDTAYGVATTSQAPYLKTPTFACDGGGQACCPGASASTCASRTILAYAPSDLDTTTWTPITDGHIQVEIFSGGVQGGMWANWNWGDDLAPVTALDTTMHTMTVASDTDYPIPSGSRYFVQGDLSMLDAPGEFYVGGGYIYYWPRQLPIAAQEILAPQVRTIVQVCPKAATGVGQPCLDGDVSVVSAHDIAIEGLTIEASDFTNEFPDRTTLGYYYPTAMVYLRTTQRIAIRNCHLKNAGTDAIGLTLANANDVIYGNLIEQSGVSGVWVRTYGTALNDSVSHTISDNKVLFTGMHQTTSWGIGIESVGNGVVAHNELRYASRALLGGGIDGATTLAGNYFGYNTLYAGTQDSADIAPFYYVGDAPVGSGPMKTLEQMIVDTATWDPIAGLSTTTSQIPFGVYLDNDSSNWTVSNVETLNIAPNPTNGSVLIINGGDHVTQTNVSWQAAGFAASGLDTNNIGVRPDFAYADGTLVWQNDTTPSCKFDSSWIYRDDAPVSDDFDGDEEYNNVAGAKVTCTFDGTQVAWASATSSNRGTADVEIDGVLDRTVDLATSNPIRQNVVYRKTGLPLGAHTLQITIRNDRAATSNYVTVDAIADSGVHTWIDDNDKLACAYTGAWTYRNDASVSGDFGGNETYSNTPGDSVTCSFTGSDVRWLTSSTSNRGTADVFIDGRWDAAVDLYTGPPLLQNMVYRKSGLSAGTHTLRIAVRDDRTTMLNYVVLDALGVGK